MLLKGTLENLWELSGGRVNALTKSHGSRGGWEKASNVHFAVVLKSKEPKSKDSSFEGRRMFVHSSTPHPEAALTWLNIPFCVGNVTKLSALRYG